MNPLATAGRAASAVAAFEAALAGPDPSRVMQAAAVRDMAAPLAPGAWPPPRYWRPGPFPPLRPATRPAPQKPPLGGMAGNGRTR